MKNNFSEQDKKSSKVKKAIMAKEIVDLHGNILR